MKSVFKGVQIFILYIIISIRKVISLLDFTYPSSIGLINENVFIIEKNGIFVYDKELKNIVYNYLFEEEGDKISILSSLSNMIIKSKGNYIVCLINRKIFLFDYEGKFLLRTGILINEENYYYPSLTPIPLTEENSYFYVISYFIYESGSYKQKVLYYKINLFSKSNNKLREIKLDRFESKALAGLSTDEYDFICMGLSCEYMQAENENDYNYLVCFLFVNKDDSSLALNYFEVSTSSISQSKKFKAGYKEINNVNKIQTVVRSDRKISLVCLLFRNGDLKCYKFHYKKGTLSDTVEFYDQTSTNFNCRNSQYAMKLNFLASGDKIVLSCINSKATVQAKFFQ